MIFNLFKKRDSNWRYREYCELEKSFNQLNSELTELAMTFSERSSSQAELVKSCKDFDILCSSNERFENFRKSHLKQIGQIKKQRDKLIKAMNSLSNVKDFDLHIRDYKSNQLNKAILNKYRRGEIDLSICDDLLKSRTKSKVKYADNIVFNEKGQILLLKRSEIDSSKPGHFTIPGGHVDPGEDCETAAKRELEEEAGIKVKDVYQVGEYEDEKVHIKYYESHVENVEPVLQEEEIWSYEWVLPKDLKNYTLPFNMAENLEKIINPVKFHVTKIKKSFEDGLINKTQRDVLLKSVIEKAANKKEDVKSTSKSILGEYGDKVIPTIREALKNKKQPEQIKGGLADGKTIQDIADHHNVTKEDILRELKMGIKVEMEHTDSPKKSLEIAKDHLWEMSDYYTRLKEMEDEAKEQQLKGLYDDLNKEYNKLDEICKSIEGTKLYGKLYEFLEKAKKDISKLNKIKKLIYRDGKLIFATYYVKTGEEVEDEKKVAESYLFGEDLIQGNRVKLKTKKREVEGVIAGFSFHNQQHIHYINVIDDQGNSNWFSTKGVTGFENLEDKKEEYTFVKNLGGSTGAQLVEDKYGNLYVKKTGKDKDHIDKEYQALKLYDYLGVKVPKIHKYDKDKGELYTEYLKESLPISPTDNHWVSKLGKDFATDALLANWDVIGLDYDNVLITSTGVYRVDVGGSLNKRAQGEDKEFGNEVKELETLLDENINPNSAKIFKDVDLIKSIEKTLDHYSYNSHLIDEDPDIDKNIKETLSNRVEFLKNKLQELKKEQDKKFEKSIEDYNYDGDLYEFDGVPEEEEVNVKIKEFYKKLNEDLRVTELDLELLKDYENLHEKSAFENLENYGVTNKGAYKEAKKLGLTDLEIYCIRDFTGGSYQDYNSIAKDAIDSLSGNVNFNIDNITLQKTKKIVKEPIYFNFSEIVNDYVLAHKSLNFALDNGKKASEMNQSKYESMKKSFEKVIDARNKILKKEINLPKKQSHSILNLYDSGNEFFTQYNSNKKTDIFDSTKFSEGVINLGYKDVEIEGKDFGFKYNGLTGSGRMNAKFKLLINGLTKLEKSNNYKFKKTHVFYRGISINGKEYKEKFKQEHKTPLEAVMHQWGSSSSFRSKGFSSGSDTVLKIVGSGFWINELSKHEGEDESEVLNRPFTIYRNVHYIEEDSGEFNNKRVITLQKVN